MILVLMGYMGSGKSTIGKKLSEVLMYNFIDLDDYITKRESLSIQDIFETKGEIYFRKKETEYLMEVLWEESNIILSLGGGTPCYGNNLKIINDLENVTSIYLKTSLKSLVSRLILEKDKRPLINHIKTEEQLFEFIGKHLFERSVHYEQANEIVITDSLSIERIVEAIVMRLV